MRLILYYYYVRSTRRARARDERDETQREREKERAMILRDRYLLAYLLSGRRCCFACLLVAGFYNDTEEVLSESH